MAETPRRTQAQLGFLVLCSVAGAGAMFTAFFIMLALPESPTLTQLEALCIANAILGLLLWLRSTHLLNKELQKRWFKDPPAN